MEEWIFKGEQIFVLDHTLEQSKILIVSLHLECVALQWHKNFLKLKNKTPSWGEYVKAVKSTFRFVAYEDPMVELKKLK